MPVTLLDLDIFTTEREPGRESALLICSRSCYEGSAVGPPCERETPFQVALGIDLAAVRDRVAQKRELLEPPREFHQVRGRCLSAETRAAETQ